MPYAVSQPVSQPLIELFEFCMNTCQPVVVHPAHPYYFELLEPFFEAVWQGFLGDSFKFALEISPTAFLDYQLVFALFSFLISETMSQ